MQAAITRLVVLVILLVNQALVTIGWNPLPFSEEQIFEFVSIAATIVVAVYAWWKNNNVSKKEQHNDKFLKDRGMR